MVGELSVARHVALDATMEAGISDLVVDYRGTSADTLVRIMLSFLGRHGQTLLFLLV